MGFFPFVLILLFFLGAPRVVLFMKIMLKLLLALADVPFRQCFQGWTRSSFIVRNFLREDVIFSSSSVCVFFYPLSLSSSTHTRTCAHARVCTKNTRLRANKK